jgi:hypothetical protein
MHGVKRSVFCFDVQGEVRAKVRTYGVKQLTIILISEHSKWV